MLIFSDDAAVAAAFAGIQAAIAGRGDAEVAHTILSFECNLQTYWEADRPNPLYQW